MDRKAHTVDDDHNHPHHHHQRSNNNQPSEDGGSPRSSSTTSAPTPRPLSQLRSSLRNILGLMDGDMRRDMNLDVDDDDMPSSAQVAETATHSLAACVDSSSVCEATPTLEEEEERERVRETCGGNPRPLSPPCGGQCVSSSLKTTTTTTTTTTSSGNPQGNPQQAAQGNPRHVCTRTAQTVQTQGIPVMDPLGEPLLCACALRVDHMQRGVKEVEREVPNICDSLYPCPKPGIRSRVAEMFSDLVKGRKDKDVPYGEMPTRLVFDLVQGIPPKKEKPCKPCKDHVTKKLKAKKGMAKAKSRLQGERMDLYYFDHGNCGYFRTTDRPPPVLADQYAQQTDQYVTRMWAELFGTVNIACAFGVAFLLQFLKFILATLLRPLTVGVLQMVSDYLYKPLLSSVFNHCVQPAIILLYNVATSLRDLCEPLAHTIGFFLREVALLVAAFRLVQITNGGSRRGRCREESV